MREYHSAIQDIALAHMRRKGGLPSSGLMDITHDQTRRAIHALRKKGVSIYKVTISQKCVSYFADASKARAWEQSQRHAMDVMAMYGDDCRQGIDRVMLRMSSAEGVATDGVGGMVGRAVARAIQRIRERHQVWTVKFSPKRLRYFLRADHALACADAVSALQLAAADAAQRAAQARRAAASNSRWGAPGSGLLSESADAVASWPADAVAIVPDHVKIQYCPPGKMGLGQTNTHSEHF